MTNNKAKLARRIYSALLSVLIVAIGFFLVLFCTFIFSSGKGAFERDVIASYLSRLAIPSFICIVMALFAPVFYEIFSLPDDMEKLRAKKDVYATLRRLYAKKDVKRDAKILSLRKKRFTLRAVCAILCALAFVPALVFLFLPSNFPGDNTSREVLTYSLVLLACAFCSAAIFVTFSFFDARLVEKETVFLKALENKDKNAESKRKLSALTVVRVAVLCVGLTLVVLGILNGGGNDVLGKAINICYECIGLG